MCNIESVVESLHVVVCGDFRPAEQVRSVKRIVYKYSFDTNTFNIYHNARLIIDIFKIISHSYHSSSFIRSFKYFSYMNYLLNTKSIADQN